MQYWQDNAKAFAAERTGQMWAWFDSLSREEWLVVLAVCCAAGFLFLKSWGRRGPC